MEKTRRSQTERREEAERRIMEAALELIAEKGTLAVTMSDIGIRAGYSRGLPYQRFGSKEKILESLLQAMIDRFNARRSEILKPEAGLHSITSILETYFIEEKGWKNTKALIVMAAEASLHEGRLRKLIAHYNRKHIEYIKKHLAIAQASGQVASRIDGESLAVIILGSLRGITLLNLTDPDFDLLAIKQNLLDIILGALACDRQCASRLSPEQGG